MNRILIFGNSGAGKTWTASKLSHNKHISLDNIFWISGGYNKKRSNTEISEEIYKIKKSSSWIIEGVFGHLLIEFIEVADIVIFLDFSWKDCKEALFYRGSESSKQLDKKDAKDNFLKLIVWASDYYDRDSKSSFKFHESLFNQFHKDKYRLHNRDEVVNFLKLYKQNTYYDSSKDNK